MQKELGSLIAEMTLEEKVSLLSGYDFWRTAAIERLGIPSAMMADGPHGLRKQEGAADHLGINESVKATCFPAEGLSGIDNQIMNVLMLRGEEGVDLEIHQYVDPLARQCPSMNHSDIGSMHFMLKVTGIEEVVKKVEALGYQTMSPIVASKSLPDFKFTYFRGPDGMMIELQEGGYKR